MKLLKKIGIVILSLLLLVLLAGYGLSLWVSKKLPEVIHAEKDFPYNISYENLDIDLISGSFSMHNAYLAPKGIADTIMEKGVFGNIDRIEVQNFSVWQLLKNDRISVNKVIIDSPDITLYHREKKYNAQDDFVKPFKNAISTSSLQIINGRFAMLDSSRQFIIKAARINFELNNIRIDSVSLEKDIPLRYRDYSLACDSLFYNAGKFYAISINNLKATDSTLQINDFRMLPKQNRVAFTRMQAKELDQFNLKAKSISIPKLDWGYLRDTLYVHTPQMVLDGVYANIYRSKEPPDDYSRKKLYSEMLRSLKFDLDIKKLEIRNTAIDYEEQLTFARPAAKVSFSKFNADITNIYSPVGRKKGQKLPPTVMDVKCLFMKSAPLRVTWSFNTPDASDAFTIMAHLQNIESSRINAVTKPLMNATTDGNIREVRFTFNGNTRRGKGEFAIKYDDLKVEVLKKDGKKENKLMTAVGNLLVKNDTKGEMKQTHVEVDRVQHKSVFNFLWRFTEQGLKQSVLPKFVEKIATKKKQKKEEKEKENRRKK